MRAFSLLLTIAAVAAGTPVQAQNVRNPRDYRVSQCLVTLIEHVEIPAREPGILMQLDTKEGVLVKQGDILGQIDSKDAQARLKAAQSDLQVAEAQAESDASVKAAEATVGVAKSEYEKSKDIYDRNKDSISVFELQRLQLTEERSRYQAEIALLEQHVARLTLNARAAQLEGVENEIMRRQITAPIDGVIERKYRHVGEWVNAGDSVYRLVRMDRLRVEGMLNASQVKPSEVKGRPVTIEITQARGEKVTRQSQISFVSSVIDSSGYFLVFAEFDNPQENDAWPVHPGSEAEMTIRLDTDVAAR